MSRQPLLNLLVLPPPESLPLLKTFSTQKEKLRYLNKCFDRHANKPFCFTGAVRERKIKSIFALSDKYYPIFRSAFPMPKEASISEEQIHSAYFYALGQSMLVLGADENEINLFSGVAIAATIWLLDTYSADGRLLQLIPVLQRAQKKYGAEQSLFFEFDDLRYDKELINLVHSIIMNRLSDCPEMASISSSAPIPVPLMNPLTAKGLQYSEGIESYQLYTDLLALLTADERAAVKKHFTAAFNNFITHFLQRIGPVFSSYLKNQTIYKREYAVSQRLYKDAEKEYTTWTNRMKAGTVPASPLTGPLSTSEYMNSLQSVSNIFTKLNDQFINPDATFALMTAETQPARSAYQTHFDKTCVPHNELVTLNNVLLPILFYSMMSPTYEHFTNSIHNDKKNIEQQFLDHALQILATYDKQLKATFTPYTEDVWELCFAFIYLLNEGDDLPWFEPMARMYLYSLIHRLPWAYDIENDAPQDALFWRLATHESTDATMFVQNRKDAIAKTLTSILTDSPEVLGPNGDVGAYINDINSPAPTVDFKRLYFQKGGDTNGSYLSLEQKIFHRTKYLLPRDMSTYDSEAIAMRRSGVKVKQQASTLTALSLLGTLSHQVRLSELLADTAPANESEEVVDAEQTKEQSAEISELQRELSNAKKELRRLKKEAHDAVDAVKARDQTIERLNKEVCEANRQLSDLRTLTFSSGEQETAEPEQEKEISFPYEVKEPIAIFGGHDTWLKAIKPLLTGKVRFIEQSTNIESGVRGSSTVWVQPNCISHPNFYKIADAARVRGVHLRYFSFASAKKCALQIVESEAENNS